jgi:GTP-binding protein HflX
LISGREVIFIDTVGFVRDLPPGIVEAFQSTLAEVLEADLLLHVADLSSSDPKAQLQTAEKILSGIGASAIPTLYVLNKADLVPEGVLREKLLNLTPFNPQVVVSVTRKEGLQAILDWITHHLTVNLKTPSYLPASFGGEGS